MFNIYSIYFQLLAKMLNGEVVSNRSVHIVMIQLKLILIFFLSSSILAVMWVCLNLQRTKHVLFIPALFEEKAGIM